jgi:hypothetical protein
VWDLTALNLSLGFGVLTFMKGHGKFRIDLLNGDRSERWGHMMTWEEGGTKGFHDVKRNNSKKLLHSDFFHLR